MISLSSFQTFFLLQDDRENEDDVPEMDFNFSEASHCSSDVFQSQLSLPNFQMRCSEDGFNITRLSGHNLLSQPYKVCTFSVFHCQCILGVICVLICSVMCSVVFSVICTPCQLFISCELIVMTCENQLHL